MSVYIIGEAGINHVGSMDTAREMIRVAKRCGADAIKFQTYVTDRICRKDSPEYATLKQCELSYDQFRTLHHWCHEIGIDFLSTPDTLEDAQFLDTLDMRWMKIGSANNGAAFIYSLRDIRTPLLISLGMGGIMTCDATYMHCVSCYPCPLESANLARVDGGYIAGFSDHTTGSVAAVMAVARGAKIIEKHFTLDCYAFGPDHHMSLDPEALGQYVAAIRQAEAAMGNGRPQVMECERKTIAQLEARK